MSTVAQSIPLTLPSPVDVYRFTVDQYDRMVRDGTIAEDDPVELLDGIVVRKMPKGPRHDASFARSRRQIERLLPAGWYLRLEGAVRIPDYNEPELDLSVIRGESDDFTDHHPGPRDVALLVEIADSSLSRDRGTKRDNYARAGIPAYWIVNLVDRQLEISANPESGVYPAPVILRETESVDLVIGGQHLGRIAVVDLLPKR
ncbi:MAG: Uma2 family endonuclease [Isosphaeraceae bacterium]